MSIRDLILKYVGDSNKDICGSFTSISGNLNYVKTGIVPNQSTLIRVWGKYVTDDAKTEAMGCRNALESSQYMFGKTNLREYIVWFGSEVLKYGTYDKLDRLYTLSNGVFKIDESIELGNEGELIGSPVNEIYLLAYNNGGYNPTLYNDFKIYKAEIIHNGSAHVFKPNPTNQNFDYAIDGVAQTPVAVRGTVTSNQWSTDCYTGYIG